MMEKKKRAISIFNSWRHYKYLLKKPISKPLNEVMTPKNAAYLASEGIMSSKDAACSAPRKAPNNIRGFHTNDWEKCIGCGTCEEICPTDAILMVERSELKDQPGTFKVRPIIDYGRCCFCALCVDTCTTGSLEMSDEYIYISDNPNDFLLMPEKTFQGEHVSQGWVKDSVSDLLDLNRIKMEHEHVELRTESFIEVVRGYSKETAKQEAARCVECGVCTSSCPVQMHIPDYIKAIWEDDIEGGLKIIYETNPLPGVCGRVCTHNCETSCAIAVRGDAIAIRWLKRYIIDNAPNELYEKIITEPVSEVIDAKVAIVGAGPSGLSAAYYLKAMGYDVHVYEEKPLVGGVMRYGIPAYRLPDTAIDKDVSFLEKLGVKFHTNTRVGRDITLDTLEKEFDAVYLASGFFRGRTIQIPGSDHHDVVAAMDILPRFRDLARGVITLDDIDIKPSALIIGGGDVAFDVARNVTRIQKMKYGRSDVKLTSLENFDELPASQEEVDEGVEEGVQFFCGNGPQEIIIQDGQVQGVEMNKCLCVFDEEGKFNPQFDTTCKIDIPAQQVFLSVGQQPDYTYIPDSIKSKIEMVRGKIKADELGQVHHLPWLFVGGDIMRGPDLISGIADGHRAAQGIDDYLYKKDRVQKKSDYLEQLRLIVKENTPELTHKQKARR